MRTILNGCDILISASYPHWFLEGSFLYGIKRMGAFSQEYLICLRQRTCQHMLRVPKAWMAEVHAHQGANTRIASEIYGGCVARALAERISA